MIILYNTLITLFVLTLIFFGFRRFIQRRLEAIYTKLCQKYVADIDALKLKYFDTISSLNDFIKYNNVLKLNIIRNNMDKDLQSSLNMQGVSSYLNWKIYSNDQNKVAKSIKLLSDPEVAALFLSGEKGYVMDNINEGKCRSGFVIAGHILVKTKTSKRKYKAGDTFKMLNNKQYSISMLSDSDLILGWSN